MLGFASISSSVIGTFIPRSTMRRPSRNSISWRARKNAWSKDSVSVGRMARMLSGSSDVDATVGVVIVPGRVRTRPERNVLDASARMSMTASCGRSDRSRLRRWSSSSKSSVGRVTARRIASTRC